MKIGYVGLLVLLTGASCLADFSYTVTAKWAHRPERQVEKHYVKGAKMRLDSTSGYTIVDLDAQTVTRVNNAQKSYSVTKFSELPAAPKQTEITVTLYVEKTGQTKKIGGYDAEEIVLTADMDSPQIRHTMIKSQAEDRLWMSTSAPGSQELQAFNQKNAGRFTLAELAGASPHGSTGDAAVREALADLELKKAEWKGVPMLEVFTLRSAAGGALGPNKQDWAEGRAQLEGLVKKGGDGAASATQALARAETMGGDPFALVQNTMESGDFSTAPLPDSMFAVPEGYMQLPVGAGVIGGIVGSVPTAAPPPPPSPHAPSQSATPQRVRVGGNVAAGMLLRQPPPVYPPLAKAARISGHVILNVVIGKDGVVEELSLSSGHPLLVQAAMDAVKQWVYKPMLLNGEPVEVVTPVDVNFALSPVN